MFRLFLVIFRHQIPRTTVHIVLQYFMSYSTYCNREPFMQSFCDVRVCCGEVAVGYEFLNFLGVLVCVYDGYGISFICFFCIIALFFLSLSFILFFLWYKTVPTTRTTIQAHKNERGEGRQYCGKNKRQTKEEQGNNTKKQIKEIP